MRQETRDTVLVYGVLCEEQVLNEIKINWRLPLG